MNDALQQTSSLAAVQNAAMAGIRVLDLSETVAGQFCCRMLADYGAEVLLVEPKGGSHVRRLPPFAKSSDSHLFFHVNFGKRSRTLDRETKQGQEALLALAKESDAIVVGSDADARLLQASNPDAVIAVVSDFGADGPYRDWRGSEMIHQALSGMMYANGLPGREPLYGIGQRASYGAGVGACVTILSALYLRGETGRGQKVSLDIAENTAAMAMPVTLEYAYNGFPPNRSTYRSPFGVIRCPDAWVCFWLYNHAWVGLCDALGRSELTKDPRFITAEIRLENWLALVNEIEATVCKRPADDVLNEFLRVRLVAGRVYSPTEQWNANPHLKHRKFWETAGDKPILGPQFKMSETPRQVQAAAPSAGEIGTFTRPRRKPAAPASLDAASKGPLTGLRVLEFTTAWAGPMAGRILGFLGAEVVHVESANKLDLWRQHTVVFNERRYPDGKGGDRPYNRNALFNSQNQNKRSLCIDVKHPKGKAALLQLAAKSDVVLCNFTAGTLERMGVGYSVLKKVRPDIIVVDMPGFGNDGPLAHAPANGFSMEMAAGMSSMIGYPGGPPMTTGPFYPDPIGGYHGAAAALMALLHRQVTGKGQYIEIGQVEASMQYIGEELLAAIESGADLVPQGNRVRWAAPHDAYQAEGDDQWVAIAVEGDEEWRTFCRVIGDEVLAADARFATAVERWRSQDQLREPISRWTRRHSKFEIAQRLQAAGIRAAPVMDPKDLHQSTYMAARKAFVPLRHPEAGTHNYLGLPFKLETTPGGFVSAAPCLGADTDTILKDSLGYAQTDIDEMRREGVTSNTPV